MAQSFVSVGVFENSVAAHAARAALASAGIASFVDGETAITALSHVGSALGGIKVRVVPEDAEAARRILDASLAEDAGKAAAAWTCPNCRESVDAGFEVCWSCGFSSDGHHDPGFSSDQTTGLNPAQSTAAPVASAADNVEPPRPDWDTEDKTACDDGGDGGYDGDDRQALILRAWRAAVIGLCLCPGLLHLYSIWQLLVASTLPCEPDEPSSLLAWAAAAIDILVLSLIATFFILSLR